MAPRRYPGEKVRKLHSVHLLSTMSVSTKSSDGRVKSRSTKDPEDRHDETKVKNKDDKIDESKCRSCMKTVSENDNAVFCEICNFWFHCRCQKITDEMYAALCQYNSELHWFCSNCNAGAGKILMSISKLHTKVEKLEDEMERIKSELHKELLQSVKSIRDDLGKVADRDGNCEKKVDDNKQELSSNFGSKFNEFENKLHNCEKNDLVPQWSDIVSKEVNAKMSQVTADMTIVQDNLEKTKSLIQEQNDKERRANNVIIYNLPEFTVVERKDWMVQEKSYCLKLFNEVLGIKINQEDIKRMLRLGRLADDKCRPVLIEFRSKIKEPGD